MTTVLQIAARPWEEQGLVQPGETPEDLEEWLEAIADYAAVYCGRASGWGEYSAILRLQLDPEEPLYYLVTAEALEGLGIEDPYDLVATSDVAAMAGVERGTVGQWQHRGLMPPPVADTSAGAVWHRRDVEEWLRRTGRIE